MIDTATNTVSATVPVGVDPTGVAVFTLPSSPPPPTITTTSLPAAVLGSAYSATLHAIGGTPPYTWSLAGGSLPRANLDGRLSCPRTTCHPATTVTANTVKSATGQCATLA